MKGLYMTAKVSERLTISPEDVDPRHDWKRPLGAPGVMNVDFEERVDFRRLHRYRLGRARQALRASKLGALPLFDQHGYRRMGPRQDVPLCGTGRRWRAAPLGFRFGGGAPPDLRSLVAAD